MSASMHAGVLVVGGGLAGAACACLLQRVGVDVLVLERKRLADKDKLCGGLVTPRSQELLGKLFDGVFNVVPNDELAEMDCVTERFEVRLHGVSLRALRRRDLDRYVVEEYLSQGGACMDAFSIRNIDLANHEIMGLAADGSLCTVSYDTLVAADGALSTVRSAVTGARPEAVLSLEAESDDAGKPLTMLYSHELMGYFWYIPVHDHAKVGCVSFTGNAMDGMLEGFAQRMGVTCGRVRGAYIPTGGDVLLEREGVRFLGDAAGLACATSGEGIYYALRSAQLLSRALETNASYSVLMEPVVKTVTREYAGRDLFLNRRFMDTALASAQRTPYGTERAVKFALRHFCNFE